MNENLQLQTQLDQVLRASDNEKDKVVIGLREQLEHAHRELTVRENLVKTLSEESRVLQKQLMDVAQQCQKLARKLNEQGTSAEQITKELYQTVGLYTCDFLCIYFSPKANKPQKSIIHILTKVRSFPAFLTVVFKLEHANNQRGLTSFRIRKFAGISAKYVPISCFIVTNQ